MGLFDGAVDKANQFGNFLDQKNQQFTNWQGQQLNNTLSPFGLGYQQSTGPFSTGAYRDPSQAFQARGQVQNSGGYSPQQQQQTQGINMDLLNQLRAQAQGQGPSLATQQMNQSMDQNARQAMGLMAAQRGTNPGLAQYFSGQGLAASNQNAGANAAQARTQEQLNAQGLLGSLGQGLSGQQMANNQFNAGEFNRALGYDTRAQNDLASQQNQQIGNMAQQNQLYNLMARNNVLQGLQGGAGGAMEAMGQGMPGLAQMAPALLAAL